MSPCITLGNRMKWLHIFHILNLRSYWKVNVFGQTRAEFALLIK